MVILKLGNLHADRLLIAYKRKVFSMRRTRKHFCSKFWIICYNCTTMFSNFDNNCSDPTWLAVLVTLAPLNGSQLNQQENTKMVSYDSTTFISIYSTDTEEEAVHYPTEFLFFL